MLSCLSGFILVPTTNPDGLQDISDVSIGASVMVDCCLLQGCCLIQGLVEGYRLHDLVLQYLQFRIGADGGDLAGRAGWRQARYLARLQVFKQYYTRGIYVVTGGLYSLIALWNSAKKLDVTIEVEACYSKSLKGVDDIRINREVGWLLVLMVRNLHIIHLT